MSDTSAGGNYYDIMFNQERRPYMPNRKTLCVDFDGVIHSYTSPWVDALTAPDPMVPGTADWLFRANKFFRVAIFSSRSKVPGGIQAMQQYMIRGILDQGHPAGFNTEQFVLGQLWWPDNKPAAHLYIDDRAHVFTGDWRNHDPEDLMNFKTWSGR